MAAVRRVFQIAARRFDLTDSSVQMNGAVGAESGWVVEELPPKAGHGTQPTGTGSGRERGDQGQTFSPRCSEFKARQESCAYTRLALICEETLTLFGEHPPEAHYVLRSPCHIRTFLTQPNVCSRLLSQWKCGLCFLIMLKMVRLHTTEPSRQRFYVQVPSLFLILS